MIIRLHSYWLKFSRVEARWPPSARSLLSAETRPFINLYYKSKNLKMSHSIQNNIEKYKINIISSTPLISHLVSTHKLSD